MSKHFLKSTISSYFIELNNIYFIISQIFNLFLFFLFRKILTAITIILTLSFFFFLTKIFVSVSGVFSPFFFLFFRKILVPFTYFFVKLFFVFLIIFINHLYIYIYIKKFIKKFLIGIYHFLICRQQNYQKYIISFENKL